LPLEFVGGTVTLSAGGTGDVVLVYARDTNIVEFLVNSTGRCEITKIEQEGVEVYTTGVLELDQLKKQGNVYVLPEAIGYRANAKLVFSLRDISGASNTVYVCAVMVYT